MQEPPATAQSREPGDDLDAESLASVVLVDRREDIAAICGRIDTAPTFAVVVHAPGGNRPLSTELGMRRLKRHAEETGRVVAIATTNPALSSRARQVGIPVARRPHQMRWDSAGRQVLRLGSRSLLLPAVGRPAQLLVIAAAAVVLALLAFTVAPAAKVTAYPRAETIERVVTITASALRSEVDLVSLQVPARPVSSTETITLAVRTTGKTEVPTLPARVVLNLANTAGTQVVVPGGAIAVAGPELFALDAEVTIAAGRSLQAQATAQRAGPVGNIAAAAITGWQDTRFRMITVTNPAPGAGGASEERPAVAAQDIVALRALAADLGKSHTARVRLATARPRDAIFLGTADTSVEVGEPSAAAGAPADVLLMEVKVTVTALAVLEETLIEVASGVLLSDQAAGTLLPGTVTARETGARQASAEDGVIRTELRVQGLFARDVTPGSVKRIVAGKSEAGAAAALRTEHGIEDVEVRVTPGWAPRAPRFGFRITVELRHRPADSKDIGASPDGANTR